MSVNISSWNKAITWTHVQGCYVAWNICQILLFIISDMDWRARGNPPPECIETRRVPAPGPGMSRCCTGGCFTLCGVHGWPPANSGWHAGWASELILSCPSCTHTYPFWTSPQAQSSGSTYGPNPRLMWVQRSISHHIPHCHVSDIQVTDPCSDLKKLTYSLFSCI